MDEKEAWKLLDGLPCLIHYSVWDEKSSLWKPVWVKGDFSDFLQKERLQNWSECIYPDDYNSFCYPGAIEKRKAKSKDGSELYEIEFRLGSEATEVTHVCEIGRLWRKEGELCRSGILLDTTARHELAMDLESKRYQVLQASKMTALGEMASGVAHEINNPLAVVHGYSSRLLSWVEKGKVDQGKLKEILGRIYRTSAKIAGIVKGLQSFARDASGDEIAQVYVKDIVDEILTFVSQRFNDSQISLEVDVKDKNLQIDCRETEISQVLLSVVNNAYDAARKASVRWVKLEAYQKQGMVEIAITDSGEGVPYNVKQRLFDPFFTTKEVGQGMGLSLSIALGTARKYGGELFLDDTSRNTRFVFQIPLAKKRSMAKAA